MAARRHRLMLIQFAQELKTDDAVKIAKMYGLPGSVIDKIERNATGMTLIQALEQRRIISEDEIGIMNEFCQTMYDLRLDHLAKKIKEAYPNLPAEQKLRNIPRPASNVIRNTEGGGLLAQPASSVYAGGGDVRMVDYASTDVSDVILSKLANCIGSEWKQIALGSLGLKKYMVEQIEEDNKTLRDKITAIFVMWRRQNAGEAGAGELLEILKDREDIDDDALKVLETHINGE